MSESAIAIAGGGAPQKLSPAGHKIRKDAGIEKVKDKKCGCCGEMFVTLARHYRYVEMVNPKTGESNKPTKCAKWAMDNEIEASALSIAENTDRKKILKALAVLKEMGVLSPRSEASIMLETDENFPERKKPTEE
jgi:hypothetical protein